MITGAQNRLRGVVYPPAEELAFYMREGVLSEQTLIGALRESFCRNAGRIALSEPGVVISYDELDEISDRTAAALWRLGLRPTDRALFQMRNCKELIYAFLGCLKVGVIPVCTLAAHREQEIGYLGNHAEAKIHIVHGDDSRFDMVAFALKMQKEIPSIRTILATGMQVPRPGIRSLEALIADEEPLAARSLVKSLSLDPFQVVLFQLSGGTSGIPKIIPRFSNEYRYTVQSVIDWLGLDSGMVAFTPNPLMHNAPMSCYWGPALLAGGEVAIAGGASLADIEATLAERRPNWIALAKVHMLRLKEAGAVDRLNFDNVFGFVVTDSAPVLSRMMGAPCLPIFGMTEGLLAFVRRDDPAEAFETVGRPTSPFDSLRIVAPGTDQEVADGETGELLVKGPCTIRGYYDASDRDAEAFTADGFYRSGDLMRLRAIGDARYLVFEGRVKDVVDRGGEKINCSEVENALTLHPAVGAVACVAMPDQLYGERLCAFVVPRIEHTAPTLPDLTRFLASYGLAKFKWPERLELLDDLPMTISGKVSKPRMREMIRQILDHEAGGAAGAKR
jgi:non-ribosomal peptide synthetase component E (peptide arylation enzyme)